MADYVLLLVAKKMGRKYAPRSANDKRSTFYL